MRGNPATQFDTVRAREAGIRSGALRRQRAAEGTIQPNGKPNGKDPVHVERFLITQLMRVRKQIDLINARIDELAGAEYVVNAKGEIIANGVEIALDRLSSAIIRLSERERILRNQPLPGSYKPIAASRRSKAAYLSQGPEPIVEPDTTTGGSVAQSP